MIRRKCWKILFTLTCFIAFHNMKSHFKRFLMKLELEKCQSETRNILFQVLEPTFLAFKTLFYFSPHLSFKFRLLLNFKLWLFLPPTSTKDFLL